MIDKPVLICEDEKRRDDVRERGFNGLDYLEVSEDQRTLTVFFLGKAPEGLRRRNVRITGGRRVRDLRVTDIRLKRADDPEIDDCLTVRVNKPGDFSTYTFCLVATDEEGRPTDKPYPNFDPRYYCLDFSFKEGCPTDLDCKTEPVCPPEVYEAPEISYLAKDYASFRQLLLDRLAVVMPDWKERHVPDIGIALVELLAYTGDHLSYYQDAVATEAYLDTARQRISVRRHARLVDYRVHEGCNARAWVCICTDQDLDLAPNDFYLITGKSLPLEGRMLSRDSLQNIPASQYEVFEPLVEDPSPIPFQLSDLKDAACLVIRLRDKMDEVSRFLREELSEGTQELLEKYKGDGTSPPAKRLQKALVGELNRFVQKGASLYDEKRFSEVELRKETKRLIEERPQGRAFALLNRSLLEDVYPAELARCRKPGEPIYLYEAHNKLYFYTWGDLECCLPRGATSATLRDNWVNARESKQEPKEEIPYVQRVQKKPPPKEVPPRVPEPCDRKRKLQNLQLGDILILEEVIGPRTGDEADADPTHRHAVRLTRVTRDVDPLYDQPVLEIEWAEEDALPFPLCISTTSDAPDCAYLEDVSIACGNVILVDHGKRIPDEDLGCVPEDRTEEECPDPCRLPEIRIVPGRYRPRLAETPLTFSQPLPLGAPAAAMLAQDPRQALPWASLSSVPDPDCKSPEPEKEPPEPELPVEPSPIKGEYQTPEQMVQGASQEPPADSPRPEEEPAPVWWFPQLDLLASNADDPHFVVEMDNERQAHLRFGDGELGMLPEADARFKATYRVGNGPVGNVGAEAISHIVTRDLVSGVKMKPRNPLPAQGGTAPEPIEQVKLFAPHTFRSRLERAITADDYAEIVMRDFEGKVQRAAAALRWTGSWYEALVVIDPKGTERADPALLDEIAGHLYRYRRIGHDLVVEPARYVPLDIELIVCVLPDYLRGHVKADLLNVFSNRALPDGRLGFFHPDNLTFGEGIYLSKLVAAAQAVPGVETVVVNKLERLWEGENGEIASGILPLGPMEVARLDNDPGFPEDGKLVLDMRGGR